ncbi:MAG: ABC transporter substrate-binding protein [Deltaproteobacteria bacterium]|nr:ABC transporter substrate-binding protein [Deltaproteobacteria bacterium]
MKKSIRRFWEYKFWFVAAVLAGLTPVIPAVQVGLCRTAWAEDGVTDSEVVIGQCAALEGPAAGLGTGMNVGMKACLDEVNAKGGINGRKIRFIAGNDGYEPDKTVDCTLNMIENEKVFALAGYVGTPTAKAALPIVQEMKVPLVGLFTGAGLLRNPVSRYIINIRASYDDETEALVERIVSDLGIKDIAVFYQDDSFGLAGLSGTEKALKKRGLKVAATGTFARNTEAVKGGLASVMAAKPGAVVMVGTENLIKESGDAANGIIISQVVPSPDDTSVPVVRDFQAALKKSFPNETPSYVRLEGYVTARVLTTALEKAGAALTREGLIDTIESMSNVDIGGLSVSFSKDNHQGLNKVYVTQVGGGKAKPVAKVARP